MMRNPSRHWKASTCFKRILRERLQEDWGYIANCWSKLFPHEGEVDCTVKQTPTSITYVRIRFSSLQTQHEKRGGETDPYLFFLEIMSVGRQHI